MITLHQGEYGVLLFQAFENDGTTPASVTGKDFRFVLSHATSEEKHGFEDFTMLETSFTLEIPTGLTQGWRPGKYNLQLEEKSTGRLIDVKDNGFELKKSY